MSADRLGTIEPANILGGYIIQIIDASGLPGGQIVEDIVVIVLVFLLVYGIGRLLVFRGIRRLLNARQVDRHLRRMVLKGLHILVVPIAVGIALFTSGNTFLLVTILAGLAAGGLPVSFALQGAIRNVFAGLIIYAERPFKIGDEIAWDGKSGTVEDIKLRVTHVRSYDNKLLAVPNSKLTEGVTENFVKDGPLRLEIHVPFDLKANVEEAKEIILEEADSHEKVLEDPPPTVNLMEFEESRILLQARIWVANHDIGNRVTIRDEFATAVKTRLDEEGIDIPYPTQRLSRGPELTPEEPESSESGADDSGSEVDESESPQSDADDSESGVGESG